ncbi:MAG: hypothetical protein CEE38_20685 [Planctomycetes bacterium B3_Pla]|nr:MAG: hypothetical protein CEE38_20685 [Planctomycetes bacterium B3_Pla]
MTKTAEHKLNALVARVGKVRRWLVTLAILKVAALCLIFVSLYVGVYAWLDHRLNFDQVGRIIAFVLLVAGLVLIFQRLTRLLLRHISCSGAANYIENRMSFDQQLVTAIEYHENKQEYPYSRALAEQLVLRVDEDSREFKLDSTVEKWQGYALGAIILIGLAVAWFYVRDNYVYFSSYFARLTLPVAAVEPLPATTLESLTKDIVAEPDSEVTFAAEIEGRVPEFGKFVVARIDAAQEGQDGAPEQMQVRPGLAGEEAPRFEASRSFPEAGRFKYRFETSSASTDWHELTICPSPQIESMTANVTLPQRPGRKKWVKPYSEQIENNNLQVVRGSGVTLDIQADDKLKEVAVTGLDGKTITRQLNGAEQFSFHFTADRQGSIKFDLVNEQGLANDGLPDLEVIVKTDEPPQFKLISPDGDYLATDVASVPIRFKITDDFGLDSAKLCLEIPGRQPQELTIPLEEGARSKEHSYTIELEEYKLTVGDSILFHAEATDIDTGSAPAGRTSSSDMYFIEIRPYRQSWRPRPGGGPGQGGMPPPVELLNILEYTRAILKKTWAIAGKPNLTERDRSALDSIDNDVRYCVEQLALIRDDSEYGFNDRQKAVLNGVLRYFEQASGYLAEHNAPSAIVPEKDAYRLLRKFILELELQWNPPSSGQGQQPQKPDSVKLQEMPDFSKYEKERIEGELKKVQQKLEKLTQEQKSLKRTFENFLEQQAEKKEAAQKTTDDKSSAAGAEKQAQDKANGSRQSKTSTGQEDASSSGGQSGGGKQDSAESQSASKSAGAAEGKSAAGDPSTDDKQKAVGKESDSADESASDSQGASSKQDSAEGRSASKSDSAGEGKSTSESQGAGDEQDPAEGPSGSENKNAGEGDNSSDGPDGNDKQNAATSRSGSEGQRSEEGEGALGSQGGGDKQDGESQSASEGKSAGKGKSVAGSSRMGEQQNAAGSRDGSEGQSSGEDKSASDGRSSGNGSGADESRSGEPSQGGDRRAVANAEARLRMLQAKQKALQEQVSQLKRDLQQLPEISESGGNKGRASAQEHLDQAAAKMEDFQEKLAEARYQDDMTRKESGEAVELMESAKHQMDLAAEALDSELTLSDAEKLAQKAQKMAEQLAEDADALDESVTPAERQDMLARLEAAKRLLEMMPEPKWATIDKGKGTQSGPVLVLTRGPNMPSAEAARQLARQFWSVAVDARKRQRQLIEDEPADVQFHGRENEFFENAAKFDREAVQE